MNAPELERRLDRMNEQLELLVARQRRQEELYDELMPVAREVMASAVGKLDALEKKGCFSFGRALAEVAEKVLDHYSADDVRALGGAIVAILDTVRALTQPEVLAIVGEAGEVLQHADQARPIGLIGMVRASRHDDVQKGMAVLMEVLRHVGRAAQAVAAKESSAGEDRKARLAKTLGPRRRDQAPQLPPHGEAHGGNGKANGNGAARRAVASCAVAPPRPAVAAAVIDGIAFTADGHLVDPSLWTKPLAERIAEVEGIRLSPEHWRLVEAARADFLAHQAAANIRRLTQVAGISTKEIFALFPRAPGRTIARIAGTPKPVGCI